MNKEGRRTRTTCSSEAAASAGALTLLTLPTTHNPGWITRENHSVETDYGGLSSADGSIIARMVGPGAGGQRGCLTRGYHGVTTTPWRKAWIEQTRREE
ncbi:uncharacterized protein BO96DRAFT_404633 [Aspergillus niger CBS 101883]|uniref:Uncharacterized protein n=2 Tax=Aspergillus niger TaxID=5061 RepID=A2RAR1_ASPNC|nr:uncharacterized protein BO96DRAFT_404633 [Aspergillus niger CBS 101883]XP_059602916.1 hypothetical protein An18g04050 [Aspergillus niger]PYH51114.1 hypothetical protein BO96DRAFT_404633 [Aspergillus niger CBS 101883]CAK43207.1 hypothetical protein An18g04050 [Aspergillus niger]